MTCHWNNKEDITNLMVLGFFQIKKYVYFKTIEPHKQQAEIVKVSNVFLKDNESNEWIKAK